MAWSYKTNNDGHAAASASAAIAKTIQHHRLTILQRNNVLCITGLAASLIIILLLALAPDAPNRLHSAAHIGARDRFLASNSSAFSQALSTCSIACDAPRPLILVDTASSPSFVVAVHHPEADVFISKPMLENNAAKMHMMRDLVTIRNLLRNARSINTYPVRRRSQFDGASEDAGLIVDVGANIGVFSLFMARAGYQVMSYEPVPDNYRRLAFSACMNHKLYGRRPDGAIVQYGALFPKIETVHKIVSNESGKQYAMASSLTNMGHSGVVTGGTVGYNTSEMKRTDTLVTSTTLDVELSEACASGRQPILLKIDVEGFEGFVLDGARRVLADCPPQHIFIELNPHLIDSHDGGALKFLDILLLLKASGYELLSTIRNMSVDFWQSEAEIREFAASLDPVKDWGDYTFRHEPKI